MLQTSSPDFDLEIAAQYSEAILSPEFMGIPLVNWEGLYLLLIRFGLNLFVSFIIIQFLYYKKSHRRDYYFTFMLFSITVFLLIFLLNNVNMQMGFALGLFAIFGMIRYRTEAVSVREMTYLFVIIGLSVINGLAMTASFAELIITNLIFIVSIWVLESVKFLKHTSTKLILYDKIDLIVPEKEEELIEDLKKRTGLNIIKAQIGHVDFLRDVAFIEVSYKPLVPEINTIDKITKANQYTG